LLADIGIPSLLRIFPLSSVLALGFFPVIPGLLGYLGAFAHGTCAEAIKSMMLMHTGKSKRSRMLNWFNKQGQTTPVFVCLVKFFLSAGFLCWCFYRGYWSGRAAYSLKDLFF